MSDRFQRGDWVRWQRNGELVIGKVEYAKYEWGHEIAVTDKGTVRSDAVLEIRRAGGYTVSAALEAALRAGAESLRTSAHMAGRRGWPVAVKEATEHAAVLEAAAATLTISAVTNSDVATPTAGTP